MRKWIERWHAFRAAYVAKRIEQEQRAESDAIINKLLRGLEAQTQMGPSTDGLSWELTREQRSDPNAYLSQIDKKSTFIRFFIQSEEIVKDGVSEIVDHEMIELSFGNKYHMPVFYVNDGHRNFWPEEYAKFQKWNAKVRASHRDSFA